MTLLDRAKEVKEKNTQRIVITQEHVELAIAWLKGEININQIGKVLERTGSGIYIPIALALQRAFLEGRLVERKEGV